MISDNSLSGNTINDITQGMEITDLKPEDIMNLTPENVEKNIGILQKFLNELPQKAFNLGLRILFAAIFFFIGVWIIKMIRKVVKKSMEKASVDVGVIQFTDSFVKVVSYFVLIFMLASSFGLDATSVVAVVGSAGVAIGLALQGSLSNFAGGVLILLLKPFKVGDYIKEDSKGNEGEVTQIQMFYTKLLTLDRKTVILPNGTLANTSLVNYTSANIRRLDVTVGISYDSDIKKAKEVLKKLIDEEPMILPDREHLVVVEELADSAVVLGIKCYVKPADYFPCKWKIIEEIKFAFDENGISIPYPQMDVHTK